MKKTDLWHASLVTAALVLVALLTLASLVRWSDGPTHYRVEFANIARRGGLLLFLLAFPIAFFLILVWHKLTGR